MVTKAMPFDVGVSGDVGPGPCDHDHCHKSEGGERKDILIYSIRRRQLEKIKN